MLELFRIRAGGPLAALRKRVLRLVRLLPPAPALKPRCEACPLTGEEHWQRATGIVSAAIARLARIERLQVAAAHQIDAAEYTLQHLLEELATAMPLPVDGAPLRAILAEAEKAVANEKKAKDEEPAAAGTAVAA